MYHVKRRSCVNFAWTLSKLCLSFVIIAYFCVNRIIPTHSAIFQSLRMLADGLGDAGHVTIDDVERAQGGLMKFR